LNIEIKKHDLTGEDVIVISDATGLISTIIPRENEIEIDFAIVSKFIVDVIKDMDYPPKINIKLQRN